MMETEQRGEALMEESDEWMNSTQSRICREECRTRS